MSLMTGWEYQCVNTTCLPFATFVVSNIRLCQVACLNEILCQAATFHRSTSKCQLFANIPDQNGNMFANMETVTMFVMAQTRMPPELTTSTTTTSSSTSTTTSSTTTTTSSSTTTTSSSTSTTTSSTTTTTTTSSSTSSTTTTTSSSTSTTTSSTSSTTTTTSSSTSTTTSSSTSTSSTTTTSSTSTSSSSSSTTTSTSSSTSTSSTTTSTTTSSSTSTSSTTTSTTTSSSSASTTTSRTTSSSTTTTTTTTTSSSSSTSTTTSTTSSTTKTTTTSSSTTSLTSSTSTTTSTTSSTTKTTTTSSSTTSLTSSTTTTTGCGSQCNTVLLLSDTNTGTVQTLVNSLQSAGLTVNYISGGITTYTGSPVASIYGSVILITGSTEGTDMPVSGQQSILNAQQNNGIGVVMTEWAAYHVLYGRWSVLSSLLLAPRVTGITATMSYTLINSGHPIWNSLATSFTTSVTLGYSTLGIPKVGAIIIANCTGCGTPAVIVAPSSGTAGRIVQIAHAGHYTSASFNWGNDVNTLTMMINAVKWAARLI